MADPDVLNVSKRDSRGTANARRDRRAGKIPAVLYGHGKDCISLSVPSEEVNLVIRRGGQFVNLAGDVSESALIRDVQWDPLGTDVLHLDLARVKADETVEISVSIELRGEAPGIRQGGVVQHSLHEVLMECPVTAIPEKISATINSLELDQSLTLADLEFPEGIKLLADPETVVVQCVEAAEELDEEEAGVPSGSVEPEVIGRKAEDEEGGD